MNKCLLLTLFTVVSIVPHAVRADSYDGPYCFESPTKDAYWGSDPNNIRGTCKRIETVVTTVLDPALQNDYLLGTHQLITVGCDRESCAYGSKYSEDISLSGGSSVAYNDTPPYGIKNPPTQVALFDRKFFVPKLAALFAQARISFSEKTIPTIHISVYKKSELDEMKKVDESINSTMDKLIASPDLLSYEVNTLNYVGYGSAIYGIKADYNPLEAHYVDVEGNNTSLAEKDLQMTLQSVKRGQIYSTPISSPLKKVNNYWVFTKKDGKLVLAWQKTEYTLDDGTVKTITPSDKNVTAAMLFGTSATPTATTTASTPSMSAKKGFFEALFDWLFGWL